jgi:hypothetical protein
LGFTELIASTSRSGSSRPPVAAGCDRTSSHSACARSAVVLLLPLPPARPPVPVMAVSEHALTLVTPASRT